MARPRTPTALKVVGGTNRPDRANHLEPEPRLLALDELDPPAHLDPRSAAVWDELAPMLRRLQVLTEADLIAFEMLCDAVADYRYARIVRGDEFVLISPRTGAEMISQWFLSASIASKRAEAFMSKFGMDPVSRSRVMVQPQGDLFGNQAPAGTSRFFGGAKA